MNQMVATRMLNKLGVQHDVVENGALAVEACAAATYECILMVRGRGREAGREEGIEFLSFTQCSERASS